MAMAQSLQMEKERNELFAALSLSNDEQRDILFPSLPTNVTTEGTSHPEPTQEKEKDDVTTGEKGSGLDVTTTTTAAPVWGSAAERMKQNLAKQKVPPTCYPNLHNPLSHTLFDCSTVLIFIFPFLMSSLFPCLCVCAHSFLLFLRCHSNPKEAIRGVFSLSPCSSS